MLESLLEWDRTLFLWLNSLGTDSFDPFWMLMTHKGTNVVVYLTAAFYYYKKEGIKALLWVLLVVVLLVLVTDQTTNFFKTQVGRLRPCHDFEVQSLMRLVKASCGGMYSFFSGHASNSFALAMFFSLLLKPYITRISTFFFLLATLIAYSRVYIGVHYPLDILVGGLAGTGFGFLFFTLQRVLKAAINQGRK